MKLSNRSVDIWHGGFNRSLWCVPLFFSTPRELRAGLGCMMQHQSWRCWPLDAVPCQRTMCPGAHGRWWSQSEAPPFDVRGFFLFPMRPFFLHATCVGDQRGRERVVRRWWLGSALVSSKNRASLPARGSRNHTEMQERQPGETPTASREENKKKKKGKKEGKKKRKSHCLPSKRAAGELD